MNAEVDVDMDAQIIEQLGHRIDDMNTTMRDGFEAVDKRFDATDRKIDRVEDRVKVTNGRVGVLEKARERAAGFMTAFRWVPVITGALLSTGATVLVMALSGAIK